ncbi:cysteine-rich protein 2-binding protein-like [Clytia hemisphaerica]|uniref:N-acetyltransferase domain-containing protein n=1 Tax=Clytia hemisphaerica TaxID=252671 RepID=A0A7M5WYJ3_9CNID
MQPATKPCKYCKAIKEGMESYKCSKCFELSHLACMKCKKPSRLKGDFLFVFECKDCNFQKKDVLSRMKLSWVQIIHLALYNLTVNERGRQGFFRWKEEICGFIDKNWNVIMPGKVKPPTWIGTIAGTLSVHSQNVFRSGQMFFNETGWWALQEVTIPKADIDNYKIIRPPKNTQDMLKNKTDNLMNIASDLGRGKRQRKTKDKMDSGPVSKSMKIETTTTKKLISPADCIKSAKIKKEPIDTYEANNIEKPKQSQSTASTSKSQCARTNVKKDIKKEKTDSSPSIQQTKKQQPVPNRNRTISNSLNTNCNIMAELRDAGYSSAVQVEDPFASLFDDMSVFEMSSLTSNEHLVEAPFSDSNPAPSTLNPQAAHFSLPKNKSSENAAQKTTLKIDKLNLNNIKTEPPEVEPIKIPEALSKPIQKLKSIKPIEKFANVKQLSLPEESEFLVKLDDYPLTVNSDCSVRRLRRKLLNRKARREKGLAMFSIEKKKLQTDQKTKNQKESNEQTTNEESKKSKGVIDTVKPDFNHPALVGVNVLDKYCKFTGLRTSSFNNIGNRSLFALIGIDENIGGYQNSITSPYTSRILKPYIRRDFTVLPPKLKILKEIQKRSKQTHRNWPIDYCYVQPMHIPAVNALCADFFWPGIDLTECLQYPEFSCVVMYRKLLIGFAFMVPDVKFNEAYISFILVHPDWRRCGIATNMIYHLIQTCMGKDITLHVSPSNPSMLLYQKFGFKAEALILDFYKKYLPEDDTSSRHAFLLRLQR